MSDRLRDIPKVPADGNMREVLAVLSALREHARAMRGFTVGGLGAIGSGSGGGTLGTGGGSIGGGGTTPGAYVPDLTPPPSPTVINVGAGITFVGILTSDPTFTQGHGYFRTNVYGAKVSLALPNPVFSNATLVHQFVGSVGTFTTDPATEWRLWLKWESVDGVESTVPSGGTNGHVAITGQDVTLLRDALSGQIRESELANSLADRINLVDGPSSLTGSVAQRILDEATARAAADGTNATAIANETSTRISEDAALASSISSLSATVSGNHSTVTAAIASEATTRASEDAALSSSINVVAARVDNGAGSSFEAWQSWDFTSSADGWTPSGAATSNGAEAITLTSSGTDPQFSSPTISITGVRYDKIRARVKRTAGAGWDGTAYYSTSGHSFTSSYRKAISDPTVLNEWRTVEWDMAALTAGGSDWTSSTITGLRLDLGASAADVFVIDWIAVGRRSVGVTHAAFVAEQTARADGDSANAASITSLTSTVNSNHSTVTAAIASEATTRADADTAISSSVTTLSSTVSSNHTTAMAAVSTEATTRASVDGGLLAQYTVKVDIAGSVAGYGLASTSSGGAPTSAWYARVDQFALMPPVNFSQESEPTGTSVGQLWFKPSTKVTKRWDGDSWEAFALGVPFVVQLNPTTINGVAIPAGTYIDAAYIINLTAMVARLGEAWITTAMVADLSADKITTGTLTSGAYMQSSGYVAGSSGWRINGNGNAEFSGVIVRGTIYATAGTIGGVTIASGDLSANYVADTSGFKLTGSTGAAEFNNLKIRGTLDVKSAATGERMEITASYIRIYNSSGVLKVELGELS